MTGKYEKEGVQTSDQFKKEKKCVDSVRRKQRSIKSVKVVDDHT